MTIASEWTTLRYDELLECDCTSLSEGRNAQVGGDKPVMMINARCSKLVVVRSETFGSHLISFKYCRE